MKVLLQHHLTRQFLSPAGNWTSDFEFAKDFGSSLNAMDFVQSHHLDQTDIVLKFSDAKYDIVLQLMARQGGCSYEIRVD